MMTCGGHTESNVNVRWSTFSTSMTLRLPSVSNSMIVSMWTLTRSITPLRKGGHECHWTRTNVCDAILTVIEKCGREAPPTEYNCALRQSTGAVCGEPSNAQDSEVSDDEAPSGRNGDYTRDGVRSAAIDVLELLRLVWGPATHQYMRLECENEWLTILRLLKICLEALRCIRRVDSLRRPTSGIETGDRWNECKYFLKMASGAYGIQGNWYHVEGGDKY